MSLNPMNPETLHLLSSALGLASFSLWGSAKPIKRQSALTIDPFFLKLGRIFFSLFYSKWRKTIEREAASQKSPQHRLITDPASYLLLSETRLCDPLQIIAQWKCWASFVFWKWCGNVKKTTRAQDKGSEFPMADLQERYWSSERASVCMDAAAAAAVACSVLRSQKVRV